jgi:hypothetical protein
MRPVPIWSRSVSFCALKSASSCVWIAAIDIVGLKIRTLGPKFGISGCVGHDVCVPIVYVALATAEFVMPLRRPMARTVRVVGTLIGAV